MKTALCSEGEEIGPGKDKGVEEGRSGVGRRTDEGVRCIHGLPKTNTISVNHKHTLIKMFKTLRSGLA